jgi:hypothetical protein
MQSKATTVEDYMNELPKERQEAMTKLRKEIKKNLPKGFREGMGYGMMGYSVPHSLYPPGYHCDPKLPLAFYRYWIAEKFYRCLSYGSVCRSETAEMVQG